MRISCFISLFLLLLASACADSPEPVGRPPIVVEGWIDEGGNPVVTVMNAVDLTSDSVSFDNFIEKWGRVSVFDGDRQYILSGRVSSVYFPEFIFTTSRVRGQQGHTYRLLVETESGTVESSATIRPHASFDRVDIEPAGGSDTTFVLRAFFGNIDPAAYYKIFTQVTKSEYRFYASFLGTFRGCDYDSSKGVVVSRGYRATMLEDENFSHFFSSGDCVLVKICTLEEPLYDFWQAYDRSTALSANLFFTYAENCPSNITGGLGYWAAYGVDQMIVRIPERP